MYLFGISLCFFFLLLYVRSTNDYVTDAAQSGHTRITVHSTACCDVTAAASFAAAAIVVVLDSFVEVKRDETPHVLLLTNIQLFVPQKT